MKLKLGQHFMNKGYYFQKVHLDKDTELITSNRLYEADTQFQWSSLEHEIYSFQNSVTFDNKLKTTASPTFTL